MAGRARKLGAVQQQQEDVYVHVHPVSTSATVPCSVRTWVQQQQQHTSEPFSLLPAASLRALRRLTRPRSQ